MDTFAVEFKKFGTLTEMLRGKIKISVGKDISGVGIELSNMGYTVKDDYLDELPDYKINKWLNKNYVKAFFTKNYDCFTPFQSQRNYVLYGISSELINMQDVDLAKIIEFVMLHHYQHVTNSKHLYLINTDFINKIRELLDY